MKWLALGLVLLSTAAGADSAPAPDRRSARWPPGYRTALPPDLPLDHQGIPTRPLDDVELHRLLLALSSTNGPAAHLLATCHAAGTPYGSEGWRACIQQGP